MFSWMFCFSLYYVPWMRCPLDYMSLVRRVPDGCVTIQYSHYDAVVWPFSWDTRSVPAAPFDPNIIQKICQIWFSFKGTVRPEWNVSSREWYHCIGLKKGVNRYRFWIFNFWSWIFDKSLKFWAASCKNETNLLLVRITVCMCSNRDLFCQTVLQKFGRDNNCSLDCGLRVKNFNIPQYKPK